MSSLKKCKAQIYILEKNGTEIFVLFLRKSLILALKCREFSESQKAKPHIFSGQSYRKSQIPGVWRKKAKLAILTRCLAE